MVQALKSLVLLASALGVIAAAASPPQGGSSLTMRANKVSKRKCSKPPSPSGGGSAPQDPVPAPEPTPTPEPTPEPTTSKEEPKPTTTTKTTTTEKPKPTTTKEKPKPKPTPKPPTGKYKIKEKIVGDEFYKRFNFETFDDPTHGRVDYVDMNTAKSQNLTTAGKNKFIMRADAKNNVGGGRGRKSVRITSKNQYKTHVVVADIRHMPTGTATWPAFWEFGGNWPNEGELDIIEGANDNGPNLSSLHTSPGCTQPGSGRKMKGKAESLDCNALANGNIGCGVRTDSDRSFGPGFNRNGGGWYAIERTEKYIKVWFWSRKDGGVPKEVKDGVDGVNPDKWGKPTALFVSDSCPIKEKFGPNNIVINLTFCGDWAGNTFPGGMGACLEMVNNNPGAFKDAYWDFARLSVYT